MAFSKPFPKQVPGSNYPLWEEVTLDDQEEYEVEEICRRENMRLMDQALSDAKVLAIKHGINEDGIRATLAVSLFEKLASHVVFWKEHRTKERWDEKNQR